MFRVVTSISQVLPWGLQFLVAALWPFILKPRFTSFCLFLSEVLCREAL
jgi:hypothetical protein